MRMRGAAAAGCPRGVQSAVQRLCSRTHRASILVALCGGWVELELAPEISVIGRQMFALSKSSSQNLLPNFMAPLHPIMFVVIIPIVVDMRGLSPSTKFDHVGPHWDLFAFNF